MQNAFWWIRQVILTVVACFFCVFGIHALIAAYKLKDPFTFIMAFFSSNLIILISATVVAGLVIRMVKACKNSKNTTE
ncbi:conserved hypothetical protein [uncultured Desulfobacterium sp.]|uniref:Uncharacterized protein n=1 Tax=uncultured Desulfobacterium sp. TaxID=201089 RepID=A0A445MZY9_9BACT|nr:conserved hypothetical protein [uncultured Desulfobacterium sp.]